VVVPELVLSTTGEVIHEDLFKESANKHTSTCGTTKCRM